MPSAEKNRNIEAIYPLSPMQEGILFEALASDNWEYFQQVSYTLEGDLNIPVLRRAWEHVVERHQALRSLFVWERSDKPLRIVRQRVNLPWNEHDWRGTEKDEQETRLRGFLRADRNAGFSFSKAPLMRMNLIRLADDRYQLVWSHHHIVIDGWSGNAIRNEVFTLYDAYRESREIQLEKPRPYQDYINWLQGQDVTRAEPFWREMLKGFTAPTPLGISHIPAASRVDVDDYNQCATRLDASTTAAIQIFIRQQRLTLNTLIKGLWAILLSHYSGEDDVVFGSVISGRPADLEGIGSMVGVFINTQPLRIMVEPDAPLAAWLRQLQSQQAVMQRYEYAPLMMIKAWSEVPHGQPLFESILSLDNYVGDQAAIQKDVALNLRQGQTYEQTNFPLTLSVVPHRELALKIVYDSDRFDHPAVERMLGHFQNLLENVVADPNRKLSALPLLTAAERRQQLVEWNNTEAAYPLAETFSQLFEAQVARTPDGVAAVCEGVQLTYAELNRRANRLASVLADEGVGADVIVALLAHRGLDLLTAILAVFKAGGAYLPLDPHNPAARLTQVLRQSGAALVLVSDELRPQLSDALEPLPAVRRPQTLSINRYPASAKASARAPRNAAPCNLAYVIYTSGSTGEPKGAMLEQRGMINHLYAKVEELGLTAHDRVAQTASQCFDISVWQFLVALLVGGSVEIIGDEQAHDPRKLLEQVTSNRITILETVPSLLQAFFADEELSQPGNFKLDELRWMILTGEALPPDLCREWLEMYPAIPLMNAYGPTECSDDVTHYVIEQPPAPEVRQMPIGRAIGNMQTYIVDRAGGLLPAGVPGELCVGGIGVGRGYLNDPLRTAGVFVPDAFGEEGQRLYRTGDLVRYLEDGRIEYLGRIDNQVKVRGFRIELGEIEARLCEHPAVREVAVLARADAGDEKRLVAYVSRRESFALSASELREFLKPVLPVYMIPSAFVLLDKMPLTRNGKVDRRALPDPEQTSAAPEKSFVAPRDEVEQELARIWESVLGTRNASIHDKFFESGGHSLLALRLLARIKQHFQQSILIEAMLQAETIEKLAELIRRPASEDAWSPLVALQPRGSRPPFFCVHPATGSAFAYVELARHVGLDQPFYGLQSPVETPLTEIEAMATLYLEAVRTIQPKGPYFLGGWSMGGRVAYEMAQQLRARGEEVALLALFDIVAYQPEAVEESVLHDLFRIVVEHVQGRGQEAGEDLDPELYRRHFSVFKNNYRASEKYELRPYGGSITVLSAEETRASAPDARLGWEALCDALEIHDLPGSHASMMLEPNIRHVAARLKTCLDERQAFASAARR
ncbi:MAG TPA: amino acid adenylation domain-containing protein [Pyrinomonadaceae bacterium]